MVDVVTQQDVDRAAALYQERLAQMSPAERYDEKNFSVMGDTPILKNVPINMKAYIYDILGGKGSYDVGDLQPKEIEQLYKLIYNTGLPEGNVTYYDQGGTGDLLTPSAINDLNKQVDLGVISPEVKEQYLKANPNDGEAFLKKLNDPEFIMKTFLGQFSYRTDENDNIIITDSYDANLGRTPTSPGRVERFMTNLKPGENYPMSVLSGIGGLLGSAEGEGAPVEINLGTMDDISKELQKQYNFANGGIVDTGQELKPPGGRRSWRDEARFRLQQALGETGERLGEGLLGESEEDKYLEFLQREYGSELPRDEEGNIDVPLSRPMRESMLDMSDLGMADKTLMILSGGGSIFPRAALSSGLLESGMLMGDAKAMIDRGETVAGGVTAALAGLPPAVAAAANKKTFADLGNEAVSGIGQFMKRNVPSIERNSMVTPEGVELPLYFSKGSDNMTGGGSRMETQTQTLKQKQTENIKNMSDSELDEFIASNEDRLADYADDVARGNELSPEISKSKTTFENRNRIAREVQENRTMQQASLKTLSPILSSRRLPGQISDTFSGSNRISATVKGTNNVTGAETIDSIVRDLQDAGITGDNFLSNQRFDVPVRLEGTLNGEKVTFSSVPISNDEYLVSLRKVGIEGTQVSEVDNLLSSLNRDLVDVQSELNQEGSLMSVKNLTKLQNKISTIEAKIKGLKG